MPVQHYINISPASFENIIRVAEENELNLFHGIPFQLFKLIPTGGEPDEELLSKCECLAQAIWEAVNHKRENRNGGWVIRFDDVDYISCWGETFLNERK